MDEAAYRNWCLKNRLFLNPLNDLGQLAERVIKFLLYNYDNLKQDKLNINDQGIVYLLMLAKYTKNEVIASMSGHVQGSRAFRRYYGITQDDREDAIKNLE